MQTPSILRSTRSTLALPAARSVAITDERLLLVGLSVLYLIAGAVVTLGGKSVVNDTWAHVANSYYVLFSRDPHLAAIGFVWLPLPSLLYLPLVVFKDLWPPLVQEAFAGNIMSALFMAGAAYQMFGWFRELGLARLTRWLLVLLFALNPMILYYGANGMSEAMFLFFVVATGRYLTRWLVQPSAGTLSLVGVAIAGAYLTRYEAIGMAITTVALVAIVAFVRGRGGARVRRDWVFSEIIVVVLPFAAVFVGWALASWLITGHPFEQFSSAYGIDSQVSQTTEFLGDLTGRGTTRVFTYAGAEVFGLVPLLGIPVVMALMVPLMRRDIRSLAVMVTIGSILAISLVVFLTGRSNGFLRYFIAAIPLAIASSACVMAAVADHAAELRAAGVASSGGIPPRVQRLALGGFLIAILAVGTPVTWSTMATWVTGREEAEQLAGILPTNTASSATIDRYYSARALAQHLDALALPPGSVLVDTYELGPVVLSSERPQQFVVTSDRDFQPILAAPKDFDVRYLVVPENAGLGVVDALNVQYPSLWADGAGMATLVGEFGSHENFDWYRLYRVDR